MKKTILILVFFVSSLALAEEREGLFHSRHLKCQDDLHDQVFAIENPLENVKLQNGLDPMGKPLLQMVLLISKSNCTPEMLEAIRVGALDRFGFIDVKITDTKREVMTQLHFGRLRITTLLDVVAEISTAQGIIEFKGTKVLSTRTVFEP